VNRPSNYHTGKWLAGWVRHSLSRSVHVAYGSYVTSNAGPYGERNCASCCRQKLVVNVAYLPRSYFDVSGRERRAQANYCGSVEMRLDDVKTEGSLGISSGDVLILPERHPACRRREKLDRPGGKGGKVARLSAIEPKSNFAKTSRSFWKSILLPLTRKCGSIRRRSAVG
jgi:hypothetical protein